MKKKMITSLMLSTVILSQGAILTSVQADTTDSKIAAQDAKISNLTAQQQSAQAQVSSIQGQVDALQAEQDKLQAENEELQETSKKLEAEITELSANIVARNESLNKQARSAQTSGSATSYINTLVNSKSFTDAISRVSAMNEIVSANNKMLAQQKADKEAIAAKQEENQEAINTVLANQQTLADDAQALKTKQAELQAAQLNLAAEKATAEGEKNELLAQKAAAEKAAAEAAEAEAAYKAQQAAAAQAIVNSGQTNLTAQVEAATHTPAASAETPAPAVTPVAETPAVTSAPAAVAPTPTVSYSSAGNTYPVGQCTWGAKVLAPWAGNYWGNGGQWAASAAAAGFRTGSVPQVGAIACWNDGGYGHVAVVTAVQSTTSIQVSEANVNGNQSIGNHRGWFNPTTAQGYVTYIYPN